MVYHPVYGENHLRPPWETITVRIGLLMQSKNTETVGDTEWHITADAKDRETQGLSVQGRTR